MRRLGSILAIGGSIALGYGALAFWIVPSLPPNGDGPGGRLLSLYVMGAGAVIVLLGLSLQNLRLYGGATAASSVGSSSAHVPTWLGVLLLFAFVVAFFIAVSYL